eukprot:Selendium_serpulae@DN5772_c0_g2_i2.p2
MNNPSRADSLSSLNPVELRELRRVFNFLDINNDGKISASEIGFATSKLGLSLKKNDAEMMIWEVDDDRDQQVTWAEFLAMYKRCTEDVTGWEPCTFFNIVQFLMYDVAFEGKIGEENTLELLFVRYGRSSMDQEINAIFGGEELGSQDCEKMITLCG